MTSKTVAEAMSRDFAKITADMPVVEAANALLKKPMFGGPVVDAAGKLVGWVSEQECLHVCVQVLYHNQRVANVSNIMRKDVLTADANQDLLDLARQILNEKPKTYPVVDNAGVVLGVISRRHILKALDEEMTKAATKRY